MKDKEALIGRVEGASGPSYQLECALFERIGKHMHGGVTDIPNYTASQDAAMRLVPDGYGVHLERYWLRSGERWFCKLTWGTEGHNAWSEDAHSAPLAISAAALRARLRTDPAS